LFRCFCFCHIDFFHLHHPPFIRLHHPLHDVFH
jgi:hypothetical protein